MRHIYTKLKAASRHPALRTGLLCVAVLLVAYIAVNTNLFPVIVKGDYAPTATTTPKAVLDIYAYNLKLLQLAHAPTSTWDAYLYNATSTTTLSTSSGQAITASTSVYKALWPVRTTYPNAGALLPFNRVVAYYGNFYSTGMGVLGQYPPEVMIPKLKATVAQWAAADPSTPVIPAIDYIAVTAQGSKGADGKYRARMPESQLDKAVQLAGEVNGIVILDIQVGLSDLPTELPLLTKYLSMPNVHLAIDPEFAMHGKQAPGTVVGTYDATDVNYAANFLANLVRQNNLPPKILIVHRFTQAMVTHYKNIKPLPEVEIVMDMDGWGSPSRKLDTYQAWIQAQPVQFTGFKLFYRNDLKPPSTGMMTPAQVLSLTPAPIFIQYQ